MKLLFVLALILVVALLSAAVVSADENHPILGIVFGGAGIGLLWLLALQAKSNTSSRADPD